MFAFVWLLVVEPLLSIAGVQKYAPGHAIASVVEGGTQSSDLLSFGAGLALSLAYVRASPWPARSSSRARTSPDD